MSAISGINSYIMNSYYSNAGFMSSESGKDASSMSAVLRNSAVLKNPSMKKVYANAAASEKVNKKDNTKNEKALSRASSDLANSAVKLLASFSGDENTMRSSVEKGIEGFVENYNKTVSALMKSNSTSALRKGVSMVNTSSAFKNSLSDIGITIKDDNTLSIDKDKLASADMGKVRSLFKGNYSLSAKTAEKALFISSAAGNEMNGTYNSGGELSRYSNNIINTLLSTNA